MSVEVTINAQTRTWLAEQMLAALLRNLEFDECYSTQIYNFFADLYLADIEDFSARHNLPDAQLKAYYETHIKRLYRRRDLEEMLAYDA